MLFISQTELMVNKQEGPRAAHPWENYLTTDWLDSIHNNHF